MIIFNFVLLILLSFCAESQADTCDVGVDGCKWTCARSGPAICMAIPGTPKSCEIGSSKTVCGTTCTCSKAETCTVGEDGCSWDCETATPKSGVETCDALPGTPKTCVVDSSETVCATTCTCSKAETCTVGKDGCSWDCKAAKPKPGVATCDAIPGTPKTCVVDSSETVCATTCTCSQVEKCSVGVNGCKWSCVTPPTPPGVMRCMAIPATPTECYPGETSSICGTTCTCSQEEKYTVGPNRCNWYRVILNRWKNVYITCGAW